MKDQTRRDWLVGIGQTTMGAGLASHVLAEENAANPLPAGLYGPSSDHLSQALTSAEKYHAIPPNCPTDYLRASGRRLEPKFFGTAELSVVRRLTELFLGDIPPELTQEIAEWIDLRVASAAGIRRAELQLQPLHRHLAAAYYGSAEKDDAERQDPATICRAGLAWLPANFLSLAADAQLMLLGTISDEQRAASSPTPGTQLFDYLKAEIIRGFYTSKVGLKELDFKGNAFYARSPGCELRS